MLKAYKKELTVLAIVFGLISYGVYVVAAPKQKDVITATRGHEVEPKQPAPAPVQPKKAVKEVKKPVGKEVVAPAPKADPNRKKPTLKAKYTNKK